MRSMDNKKPSIIEEIIFLFVFLFLYPFVYLAERGIPVLKPALIALPIVAIIVIIALLLGLPILGIFNG